MRARRPEPGQRPAQAADVRGIAVRQPDEVEGRVAAARQRLTARVQALDPQHRQRLGQGPHAVVVRASVRLRLRLVPVVALVVRVPVLTAVVLVPVVPAVVLVSLILVVAAAAARLGRGLHLDRVDAERREALAQQLLGRAQQRRRLVLAAVEHAEQRRVLPAAVAEQVQQIAELRAAQPLDAPLRHGVRARTKLRHVAADPPQLQPGPRRGGPEQRRQLLHLRVIRSRHATAAPSTIRGTSTLSARPSALWRRARCSRIACACAGSIASPARRRTQSIAICRFTGSSARTARSAAASATWAWTSSSSIASSAPGVNIT